MPSPGALARAGQRRRRPSDGGGGGSGNGGQSSPGTCSPSIASSLSGTRALPNASNAAVGGSTAAAGAEARDDMLGGDYPPSSSSAAAVMAAEEAAMDAAGSGSCGIGLPSMIKDNLVISVVSGDNTAAASAASSSNGKGPTSSASPRSGSANVGSPNDGRSSTTRPNNKANGTSKGGHRQSPQSRARHNLQMHPQQEQEEVAEEEGLLDWVGSSIQSACDQAYDVMFPPTIDEKGNAESKGNGSAAAPPASAAQTQDGAQPLPSSSSTASSGLMGNYLMSGAKSPVSFATSNSSTAAANDMAASEDDPSPVRASKANRGYRRAQMAPPPTSTSTSSSMDHADQPSARRRGSETLQTAASMDSVDSRGRRLKSRVAASLKMSRSRSDNRGADDEGTAQPSPPKAASFDAAAAGSRDEQDGGSASGLRLSSLRPPLGPRLGTGWGGKKEGGGTGGGTISWTMMHDKLIDELFEASRRQYIATHLGGGEGGQKGHHHHLHEQQKEKEQKEHSGWRLGNLLPGGGGGNDADVVGSKSKKKEKRRKRKRPKILWRKKKKEEAAAAPKTGAIGASVTSALAAAASIATGGAASAKEKSDTSPRPAKGKQSKVSSDPLPATESNTSSPFLPRIGRFSPSKKKSSDSSLPDVHRSVSFAKGTAGPKRSIIRATGEYTGRQNPDPGTYLHPKCRLQKDKGRGEIPGNAICAVSREKALKKLREKVDVIIEVEQSSTASTKAKLKLKQAVLNARAKADDGMIETRSIISVKMGFLSMKYGILLRWDAETGLVHLIVLRKMCPTGFLAGDNGNAAITADAASTAAKAPNRASATAKPSPAVPPSPGEAKKSPSKRPRRSIKDSSPSKHGFILGRFVDGANAILHGKGWDSDASAVGTEVAHLGPPYLVQRPESFADATLSVTVLRAEDLCAGDSRGSDWVMNPYVRLSIGAQTHRTRALKMTTSPIWNNTCCLAVSNNPRDDDQHLKVEVYDWRPLRRDRILGVVFVPVSSVEPQKSSRNGAEPVSTEVTIPVRMMRNKKGPYGYVTLSLVHQNDHLCWLKEELKARGRE